MRKCEGDYCTVRNWCSQNTEHKKAINHFFISDLLFHISDGSESSSRRYLFRYSRQITDTPSSVSVLYCHVSTEHNGAQKNDHHERLLSVKERPLWAPANCEELSPYGSLPNARFYAFSSTGSFKRTFWMIHALHDAWVHEFKNDIIKSCWFVLNNRNC